MSINEPLPTLVTLSGVPVRTVVWLSGEHDTATRVHLSATLARAAELDDSDIIVDLSGVTFMDASTIGALIEARNHLRVGSRSLSVRDPSLRARRVLDLCGLTHLIDESDASPHPRIVTALGSWVEVPTWERGAGAAHESSLYEPARGAARRCVAPAEQVEQRRATS